MKSRAPHILFLIAFACLSCFHLQAQSKGKRVGPVALNWLWENNISQPTGVSWGVPMPRGAVKKGQAFSLATAEGKQLPLQSWPLAYWPDGSLKWVGFATVADQKHESLQLQISKEKQASSAAGLSVKDVAGRISINSGALQCIIPKSGSVLLDSILVEGKLVGSGGHLECVLQDGPDGEVYEAPAREKYISKINKVTLEQGGPVRAVVKVEGVFQQEKGDREWLPFSIRLYFYAGSAAVRMVNTLTYDGDEQQDFIKGVGMVFAVPMQEQMHNRHIRFAGEDTGIWAEPVRPLVGRRVIAIEEENVFPDQVEGKRIPNVEAFEEYHQELIQDLPVWNDYKLVQHTASGFTLQKRAHAQGAWLDAAAGERATGLAFVGDSNGGLAIGLKDFWQSYPAALEVKNAATDMAELKLWLWSPYAEPMDMRHYDTVAHGLQATYEDVQEGLSTPYGVARTSEITLFASAGIPSNEVLSQQAKISQQPPLLVASPEYLHAVNTFGIWSLPDRSTPGKVWVEDQLDKAIDFYQEEIDNRNWYGFWNYGDVMHAYDPVRHNWRYDIGGFAWANTELAPDMWLWYSFLRTGRSDIFKMAEAMTRHTSEVDVYHLGELAGLGSRHNVRHWGCGSKEVRVSQAPYRRFYYYLTTDERTGDMMHEVAVSADKAMTDLDPLRMIIPENEYPTHARVGPDWIALAGNWMTEWERTGDKKWRNKIMAGIKSFEKMSYGLFSGQNGAFGYDPATNKMYMLKEEAIGTSHLTVLMGGPEVAYELADLLQEKSWDKLWLQYSSLYGAPEEEVEEAFGRNVQLGHLSPHFARLPAYVAEKQDDPALAARAWDAFLDARTATQFDPVPVVGVEVLKPVKEITHVSTNNTAQWSLNAIQMLELVGDKMPEGHSLWTSSGENTPYEKGELLYKDNFDSGMEKWVVEAPQNSSSKVEIINRELVVDVNEGTTVWFGQKLSGNLLIEYKRKVMMAGEKNDRLSDLNNFWMATDPRNETLFTRSGLFPEYDSLLMYYVGVGGNYNTTTRFRKYTGDGTRVLHSDLQDEEHLLQPNKEYVVKIVVYNGVTKFFLDGKEYFSFKDPDPLREGYFGFRTTKSRHNFDDFRVYRLK